MKLRPGNCDERGRVVLRIVQRDKTDTAGTSTDADEASNLATAATAAVATPSSGAPVSEEDASGKSRAQPPEMVAQGASQVNHLAGKS